MKKLKTYHIFNESQINILQFEEDKNFISDTLLELQDRGFFYSISNNGLSKDIGISEHTPYFIIAEKYHMARDIYISTRGSTSRFKFSDVKDELLQIKSYLDDRWFKCGVVFENDPKRIEVYIDEKDYDHLDDWFQTSTTAIVNLAVFFNI
jgi:hypothetical protein